MEVKLILDALRILETVGALVANWTAHASPAAIKALVDEAHAQGQTIDMAKVAQVVADMKKSGEDLDAKIAAHGG